MYLVRFGLFLAFAINLCLSDEYHPSARHRPAPRAAPLEGENIDFWLNVAEKEIESTLKSFKTVNSNKAKNVIIFVGDGMSLPTLTAARIYKAQYEGKQARKVVNGEESLLTFEKFPNVALSKTYAVDAQTPDSASTATALFSGVKTNIWTMGFDNAIVNKDPASELKAKKVETILKWAQDAGKDTGFITTTRVTHATPGSLYAHSADRDWECNKPAVGGGLDSKDITWQLVNQDPGRKAKVVMGGGLSSFLPADKSDDRFNYDEMNWDCLRKDNMNLLNDFMAKNTSVPGFENSKGAFVRNRGELNEVDVSKVDYLLGLFNWGYMKYEHERELNAKLPTEEPSITEMTKVAINLLKKNENGFFLMVEGGKIDVAHHDGWAASALHETMAFDNAIKATLEMVDLDETLIVVTADHGHTMTMSGYQSRGIDVRDVIDTELGKDGKPYSILSYANGPGFYDHFEVEDGKVSRVNISEMEDRFSFEFHQPGIAPLTRETHSGCDVGIFATGPYGHLFHGVHEQNYVAYVMAYSSCIGPYKGDKCHKSGAIQLTLSSLTLILAIALTKIFS